MPDNTNDALLFSALIRYQKRDIDNAECVMILRLSDRTTHPAADLSKYSDPFFGDLYPAGQLINALRFSYGLPILGCEEEDYSFATVDGVHDDADRFLPDKVWMAACPVHDAPPYTLLCDFLSVDLTALSCDFTALLFSSESEQQRRKQLENLIAWYAPFSALIGLREQYACWHAQKPLPRGLDTPESMQRFWLSTWLDDILLQGFARAYMDDPDRFSVPDCFDAFRRHYGLSDDLSPLSPVSNADAQQARRQVLARLYSGQTDLTDLFRRLPIFSGRERDGRLLLARTHTELFASMLGMVVADKLPIRQCKNCGRYFVPLARADEEYCLRPIEPGSEKTCRSTGPSSAFMRTLKNDSLKREARRLYNMLYNRAKYHEGDPELRQQFEEFRSENEKRKAAYKSHRLSAGGYAAWLEEMSLKYTNR